MRRPPADFQNQPLGDMVGVGAVGPHSVRLWLRSEEPGQITLRWWPENRQDQTDELVVTVRDGNQQDNTLSVMLSPEETGPRLVPLRNYRFQAVHAHGQILGEGRFETAPENPAATPARFSLALFSCHQPFDKRGRIAKRTTPMLRAVRRCLEEHHTKGILLMGDQMYSDFPPALSLFDSDYFAKVAPFGRKDILQCSADEVRRLYQHRYRHFWSLPEWRALQANFPNYPILDDHDIIDNWGSDPAHREPEWQQVCQGARQAYLDYQGSRIFPNGKLPPSFHYSFTYGHTGVFVMDLRSERIAGEGGQLYSDVQEEDLRAFLKANSSLKLLLLVLSVPIVHLPRFLAKIVARLPPQGEDFSDRWSSGVHLRDRDRFFHIIRAHQRRYPDQKIVFLSGDIHIGCVHQIQWAQDGRVVHQLISSPVTHDTGFFIQLASKLLMKANRRVTTENGTLEAKVRFLTGTGKERQNPYGGLNLGMVEIETPAPDVEPEIRLLLFGHRGERPVCAYRSPPL